MTENCYVLKCLIFLLHRNGMKLGDFCFITNVNTQKNQGDDSDMLKGCKKKKKTVNT